MNMHLTGLYLIVDRCCCFHNATFEHSVLLFLSEAWSVDDVAELVPTSKFSKAMFRELEINRTETG